MYQLLAFTLLVSYVSAASKLPPMLKICKQSSPDVEKCLTQAVEEAVKHFKAGYAPLKMNGVDPLVISKVHIDQGKGPVAINLTFIDLKIEGFSNTQISKPKLNMPNYQLSTNAFIPNLKASGLYAILGKVLVLPIKGEGDSVLTFKDVNVTVLLETKQFTKNNEKYIRVENFKFDFNPKKMTMKFDNLFNGDKALGDNMNKFLNENWPDILGELKGAITQAIGLAFADIANRLFTKVSINEIFPQ